MEALWQQAARTQGDYSRTLWVIVLALLYGTGLRRGELERLDLEAFDRTEATLQVTRFTNCTSARASVDGSSRSIRTVLSDISALLESQALFV